MEARDQNVTANGAGGVPPPVIPADQPINGSTVQPINGSTVQPFNGPTAPAFGAEQPLLMGLREYGRHRETMGLPGTALRAVQKAIEVGRIKTVDVGGRKMIDARQADRDWAAHTNPQATKGLEAPAPRQSLLPGAEQFVKQIPTPEPLDDLNASDGYAAARRKREEYHAKLLELQYGERAGTLVARDEIYRFAYECAIQVRRALESISGRRAAELAAIGDEHEIRRILDAEHRAALLGLVAMLEGAGETAAA